MADKSKEQLQQELAAAQQRIDELERAAALVKVGQEQRMLQAILDNIPAGVFVAEVPSGKPLLANKRAQELLGKGIAPDASQEDLAEVYAAYRYRTDDLYPAEEMPLVRGMSGESAMVDDMEIHKPDGEKILLQVFGSPIYDAEGQITSSVAIFQDITQRRMAEDEIEAEVKERTADLQKFISLIENSSDFISTADLEGNVVYANPMGLKLVGLPPDTDPTTTKISDYHSPEWARKIGEEYIPEVMEKGLWSGEIEMQHTDGTAIPASGVIMTIKNEAGEITGLGAIYRDMTVQKKAEEKLRQSEGWLNLITTNIPIVIFAIDQEGIFTLSEGKGLAALGLEPGQVVGLSAFDVYKDAPQICDDLRKCLAGETVSTNTILGSLVLQAVYSPIFDEKDEVVGLIGLAIDVSETHQAEAERERLQQEVIEAQRRAIAELSTPVIPIMDRIIVMPMVGSIDSMRARDITRALLAGIGHHRAKVVILDVTGVSLMDTGIVNHLNKTIQAARLKGAQAIVTGISDAVAESIVDLGIDWSEITTLSDLQTGLLVALDSLGVRLTQ